MRSFLPNIIALVFLIVVSSFLGWVDAFHAAFGIPSIIMVFLVMRWWKKRGQLEEEELEMESEIEEEHESVVWIASAGLAKAVIILALLFLVFWLVSKTPFYGVFYDNDWEELSSKISVLANDAHAWPEIVQIAENRLSGKLSLEKQKELALIEYQALIEWARETNDLEQRLTKLQKALSLVQKYSMDSQLAEAEIRAVEAEINLQSPLELTAATNGVITQIDTSIFPPTLVAYVSIEDENGKAIDQLRKRDFEVREDGRLVTAFTVANVYQQDKTSTVLAIDTSGSTKGEPLKKGKEGAKHFTSLFSGMDGQMQLIALNGTPSRVMGWTRDIETIHTAIDNLKSQGNTAIYDAIWIALESLSDKTGHKSIVLCTDGEDTSSVHGLEETIDSAKRAGVPIYTLGLKSGDLDSGILKQIAEETGGLYLEAANSEQLMELYNRIGAKIKNEYRFVIEVDREKDSEEHKITIKAGKQQNIRMERPYRFYSIAR